MNRLFGFFKEKLLQAKEENQNELQHILSAIDFEAYSEARMLNLLQQIKTNYLEWNIMIANEASTGLYFTQAHHKTALLRHLRARRDSQDKQERLSLTLTQMRKTLRELQAIEKLNYQWTNSMNERVQALAQLQSRNTKDEGVEVPEPQMKQQQIAQSQQQQAQKKQSSPTTERTSKEEEEKVQQTTLTTAQVQQEESKESPVQQSKDQTENDLIL